VTLQVATDYVPTAFVLIGVSALLELTGLTLWGAHLVMVMTRAYRIEQGEEPASAHRLMPGEISRETIVADAITAVPETLDVLIRAGFTPLKNPILRRTLARTVTLEQACRRLGLNPETIVQELNALTGKQQP
jgi:hypothetical protein